MKLARREFLRLAAGGLAIPFTSQITWAQAYPPGPVRIMVGFPPVDIAARLISPWLSERLGQPFMVENLPGESGNLATSAVAKRHRTGPRSYCAVR